VLDRRNRRRLIVPLKVDITDRKIYDLSNNMDPSTSLLFKQLAALEKQGEEKPKRSYCEHKKKRKTCLICSGCVHYQIKSRCRWCNLTTKKTNSCPHQTLSFAKCVLCNDCGHGKFKRNCVLCRKCPHDIPRKDCVECLESKPRKKCIHGKTKHCSTCFCKHGIKLEQNCPECIMETKFRYILPKKDCEPIESKLTQSKKCIHGKSRKCLDCWGCEHGIFKRYCLECVTEIPKTE
jgi:hypothetical protein